MVALTAHPEPTTPAPFPRADLLTLLLDPTKSLHDVAASLHTTLDNLSLFLASAEGETLLSQAERITTLRTRALAAAHLPKAIAALGTMLDDYNATAKVSPNTRPTNIPNSDTTLHLKHHDHARRAAHLLLRLAYFNPHARTPAPHGAGLPPGGSTQRTLNNRAPSPALPAPAPQSPGLQPGQSPPTAPTRAELSTTSNFLHKQVSSSSPPRPSASSAYGSALFPPAASAADRCEGPDSFEWQPEALRASPSKTHPPTPPPLGRTTNTPQASITAPSASPVPSPQSPVPSLLARTGAPPLPTLHCPIPTAHSSVPPLLARAGAPP